MKNSNTSFVYLRRVTILKIDFIENNKEFAMIRNEFSYIYNQIKDKMSFPIVV